MEFRTCSECNEYKYIQEDGMCHSCVDSNSDEDTVDPEDLEEDVIILNVGARMDEESDS